MLRFNITAHLAPSLTVIQRKDEIIATITQHQVVELAGETALGVIGQIEAHPKQQVAFIMRNHTNDPWFYEYDGQSFRIEPTQARPLALGGKIKMGTTEIDIVAM